MASEMRMPNWIFQTLYGPSNAELTLIIHLAQLEGPPFAFAPMVNL
jgi:hypothetical protein